MIRRDFNINRIRIDFRNCLVCVMSRLMPVSSSIIPAACDIVMGGCSFHFTHHMGMCVRETFILDDFDVLLRKIYLYHIRMIF